MDLSTLFSAAGGLALTGWLALVLAPLAPRVADAVSGLIIPALLSTAYVGLILAFWSDAPGGFDSLDAVMLLFTSPPIALAGWLHYLAFDLLVGAFIVREARRTGMSHLLVLPVLPATFLFGPAGFLLFLAIRTARRAASLRPAPGHTP